jgi:hypothetical protein
MCERCSSSQRLHGKGWSRSTFKKRFSQATKPRRPFMSTDRLQLALIPEAHHGAQPLPPDVRERCVEVLARMLLGLVNTERVFGDAKECRDESR